MANLYYNTEESIILVTDVGDTPIEIGGRAIVDSDVIGDVSESQQWKMFVAKNVLLEVTPEEAKQIKSRISASEEESEAVDAEDNPIVIDLEADLRANLHDHDGAEEIVEDDADNIAEILGGDEEAEEIANEIVASDEPEVESSDDAEVNEETSANRQEYLEKILSEIDDNGDSEDSSTIATVARPENDEQNKGTITTEQREMGRVEGDSPDPRFIEPNNSKDHAH